MQLNILEDFSPCQSAAFDRLTGTPDNIFLTGSAGTGKSFLIRKYLECVDEKAFPIVASTGAAAILVGGRTFHSFFGLGIMEGGLKATIETATANARVVRRLRKLDGIIIDEISMITGPALEAAEAIVRQARQSARPWGGLRIIAVGDFSQLPPVSRHGTAKAWAFLSDAWQASAFTPIQLETMMRSDDAAYLQMLQSVRAGEDLDDVEAYLQEKFVESYDEYQVPHLFARRHHVETFNLKRLDEVRGKAQEFPTTYIGDARACEMIKKYAPIPEMLQLKKQALVMIRVNDPAMRFINGSLGTIQNITDEILEIKLQSGRTVEIAPHAFSYTDADSKSRAVAENFPVTLAYATTIHKAQGSTMDCMACDLSNLWEPGHAYVALSRLTSGAGLHLLGWNRRCMQTSPQVRAFYRQMAEAQKQLS
jgi:ATP-dependent DNA helicase PIF1